MTMNQRERFAIVWLPAQASRLAECGASWTGWCPESARRISGASDTGAALSEAGSRMRGLHAPILQPFTLPSHASAWALQKTVADIASGLKGIDQVRLTVQRGPDGVRLAPAWRMPAWRKLSAHMAHGVRKLTGQSVPAPSVEMALSLTDSLPEMGQGPAEAYAARHFEYALAEMHSIADIALLETSDLGRPWTLVGRYDLSGDVLEMPENSAMACVGANMLTPLEASLAS